MITTSLFAVLTIIVCMAIAGLVAVSTAAFIKYERFERLVRHYLGVPLMAIIIGTMYYSGASIGVAWRGDSKLMLVLGVFLGIIGIVFEYAMLIGVFVLRFGLTFRDREAVIIKGSPAQWLLDFLGIKTGATDVCRLSWNAVGYTAIAMIALALIIIVCGIIYPVGLVIVFLASGRLLHYRDAAVSVIRGGDARFPLTRSYAFCPILCLFIGALVSVFVVAFQLNHGYRPEVWHWATYSLVIAVCFCWLGSNLDDIERAAHRKLGIEIPLPKPVRKAGMAIAFAVGEIAATAWSAWATFKGVACPKVRVE